MSKAPKWLIYASISMVIWAIWSLVSPSASRDLSASMVQMLSSVGLIPCAAVLLFSKNLKRGTNFRRGWLFAVATGITAGWGNIMLYEALKTGPVSLIFPITSMAPIVPIFAAPILFRERIRSVQGIGVAIALAAIVLLNTVPAGTEMPGFHLASRWMVYTLLALLLFGVTFLTQKASTYYISDELSTVAYTVGFLLLDIVLLATNRNLTWNIPARAGWLSLFIGVLMGLGSLTLFAAYRHGKASIVTPFSQLFPVITVLCAVPLYHEPVDWLRGIGIVLALAAGILLSLENEEAREPLSEGSTLGEERA